MFYFSYGSNMSEKRLRARVPSAKPIAVSVLANHELVFHKLGKDGSAKCDAAEIHGSNKIVIGVVYDISESEKSILDLIEGLGYGYNEKSALVLTTEGVPIEAITYYATNIDTSVKPYHWYKEHVVRGALENGLPSEYILKISAVTSIDDTDPDRHSAELAIYDQNYKLK